MIFKMYRWCRYEKQRWILWIPVIIIVLGMAGYMSGEGYGFYEALLASMKLIRVELDPLPPNLLIEMGRWLGIILLCARWFL